MKLLIALVLALLATLALAAPARGAGAVSANNVYTDAPHAHGYVLVIHGGGWYGVGRHYMEPDLPAVAWFLAHGWSTYTIDYRPGTDSLDDSKAAYDLLRVAHPSAPICVYGQSAGGNIALLLTEQRPSVACAIVEAAPTDLPAMTALTDPGSVGIVAAARHWLHSLTRWSPVTAASRLHVPVLAAGASTDMIVPEAQQLSSLKRAYPRALTMLLPGGPATFTHVGVTPASLASYHRAEARILAEARP